MQNYSTILGVVQMRLNGESYRTVKKRYSIGSSTVALIMDRFKETSLSLEDLRMMEPKKVEELFYPSDNLRRREIPMPDFEKFHQRMLQMKHPDLSFLWLEYKAEHPDGYQLSQFYKLYGDYVNEHYGSRRLSMPVERIPGEKLYIDWVGDQPELLVDPETGEISKVHVFTTTLGFSSLVYAEVFPDEKLPSFLTGVTHALQYYGAVPKYLVPDNLKAAVTKHTKDELVLNSVFSDLEDFYNVVILPPPARKPKGKASVENHVRYLETHLIEKLRENIYTSYEALNDAAKSIIKTINSRPFRKKNDVRGSRQEAFVIYDKPRMRTIPDGIFTLCDYKYVLRVPDNYHLEYDGHYYSVLYTYHNKPAILKATISEIHICDENNRLICKHERSYQRFPLYITDETHMPPNHRYYKEVNAHDGAYYRRWAAAIGEPLAIMIDRILRSVKHEEQAYNSCAGILHMCKDAPRHLVCEAAQKCVDTNACKYTYFKRAFQAVMNDRSVSTDSGTLPSHSNIRGRDSYR